MYDQVPFDVNQVQLKGAVHVNLLFAKNHRHMLHQHDDRLELLYVYSGSGTYRAGSREYAVSEGDLIICGQNVLHGERFALKNELQTYCLQLTGVKIPDLYENTLIPEKMKPVIRLKNYREIVHRLFPEIYRVVKEMPSERTAAVYMARSVLLMTWFELQRQEKNEPGARQKKREELVRRITEYLDRHYTREVLKMEDMCKQFHFSESHLSHVFKKETGLSPKQYIVLRRVGEAQSLLENDDISVGEIADKLGFGSIVHLNSIFRKYVGISPRAYRNEYRAK